MATSIKSQQQILSKLGIKQLNDMQEEAQLTIQSFNNVLLLSPTGTGKTLAFLLPIIAQLDTNKEHVQALILVPSRELALQIEQVLRDMGTGYKVNAIYGGRAGAKDKIDLKQMPSILIGTPGRIADRFRRDTINKSQIKHLILDEFDKSLEIGFEEDMKQIITALPFVKQKILTSATQGVKVPSFVKFRDVKEINYLDGHESKLEISIVESDTKDKLETLVDLLQHIGNEPGIVFCNFKDSIKTVSDYLNIMGISHGCFFGGMEQKDRERVLIKFRNGTHQMLIATDLAARGLDIPELKFIIHYQLPHRIEEFTHRNGRTARMKSGGQAYILKYKQGNLPHYIEQHPKFTITNTEAIERTPWVTLFISGGRKDKISKGDIAGLCFKQGGLTKESLGIIELKQDCAFIGVLASKADELIIKIDNTRLKKKKVRVKKI